MPLPLRVLTTENVKLDADFETVEELQQKSYGKIYLNFLMRVFLATSFSTDSTSPH